MKERNLNPGQYFFSRSRTWEEKIPHDELRIAILRKWIAKTERLITLQSLNNESNKDTLRIYPQMPDDTIVDDDGSFARQISGDNEADGPEPNEPEHNYPQ